MPRKKISKRALQERVHDLEQALAPFALYAPAVWKKKPMQPIAKKKHQAIVASAFHVAAMIFWEPYGKVDMKTGHPANREKRK